MARIQAIEPPKALPRQVRRVLYIGPAANEVCSIIAQHVGEIDMRYESDVSAALVVARQSRFDTVIVDQRDDRLATRLVVPLMAGIGYPVKLVVVSQFKDVGQYLAVPGVARVLTAPVREGQLLRVLGLQFKPKHYRDAPRVREPSTRQTGIFSTYTNMFFDRFTTVVSTAHKRLAFAALMLLFVAFVFYGGVIGYFLLSTSWGAPMSLARGHELVDRTEKDLMGLRAALNQTDQSLTEIGMEKIEAERLLNDATLMVKYALGTTSKEISLRARQYKNLKSNMTRLKKVRDAIARQPKKGGTTEALQDLYKKRLIDKKTFNSASLGLLEASQRLAKIEGDIKITQSQLTNVDANRAMLHALKAALEKGGEIASVASVSSELILLTKQSIDAKATLDLAASTLKSNAIKARQLSESQAALKLRIAALESSALARAIKKRVVVVFVPSANLGRFHTGAPLYSCLFTIFACQRVGSAGDAQPGEINSMHPFFGTPIRGQLVEANLTTAIAATRQIIHGSRKPFFF